MTEQYSRYMATIAIRPTFNGFAAVPEVAAFNGQRFAFTGGWICEPDERYAGERAMLLEGEEAAPLRTHTIWIAEGDLTDIEAIQGEQG